MSKKEGKDTKDTKDAKKGKEVKVEPVVAETAKAPKAEKVVKAEKVEKVEKVVEKVAVPKDGDVAEGTLVNIMDDLQKKQAFKKFSWRGKDINQLLAMKMPEFAYITYIFILI